MKINNSNKGFIVQGVIALVALVLIGGGAYYAGTKKIEVVENSHIITSISKSSGRIGDTIEIKGTNLLDARGDQNLRIMNSKGEDASLGPIEITRVDGYDIMSFTLTNDKCKEFGSDRGGPCMSDSMDITPGEYNIYVKSVLDNFESNKIKFTVVENTNSISTSNWKTYSSNKYGFEFKYPSDWSITEEASEGEIVVATPTNNSVNYSIDNFFIGVLASPQSDRSAPKFICKDFSWKKESSTSPRWSMFKCLERNLYINLTATNEEMKMTLEKILSTFKFTSPNLAAHECQMNSHLDVKVDGCVMDPGKGIPSTDNLNSSIKPYITVLSPNGGEIYKAGNTMKINWIATNTENIAISVNTPDGFLAPYGTSGAIIGALIPNNGSYLWTIPQAFPAGTYRISATIPYNSATKLSGKDLSDSTFTIIK